MLEKGVWTPQVKVAKAKGASQDEEAQGIGHHTQTPFLNPNPFHQWYRIENVARVKINGESCLALLSNSSQINTIMLGFVKKPFC